MLIKYRYKTAQISRNDFHYINYYVKKSENGHKLQKPKIWFLLLAHFTPWNYVQNAMYYKNYWWYCCWKNSSEFLIYWLFVQYDLQSIERVRIFTFCTELNEEIVITPETGIEHCTSRSRFEQVVAIGTS